MREFGGYKSASEMRRITILKGEDMAVKKTKAKKTKASDVFDAYDAIENFSQAKPVKRWKPSDDEDYFYISSSLTVESGQWGWECEDDKDLRRGLGVYKTKSEAKAVANQIKDLVIGMIGKA